MQRYVIIIGGTNGNTNNDGSQMQAIANGRIKAVQFHINPTPVYGEVNAASICQLSANSVYTAPTNNGTQPNEIAAVSYGSWADDTATQSKATVQPVSLLLPADFPVRVGDVFYVNFAQLGAAACPAYGMLILHVE